MEMLAGDDELLLNGTVSFSADYEYEDEEVLIAVDDLYSVSNYTTILHFYSYKKDSKTELAIDESVTIKISVATTETAVDNIAVDNQPTKILHNGQMLIQHNGEMYSIVGQKIAN